MRSTRVRGAWMSRSARRDVRQAVALAAELNLYSVALHGKVWTLRHDKVQPKPEMQQKRDSQQKQQGNSDERVARRRDRSNQRLQDFQKARRFRLDKMFRLWQLHRTPEKPPQPALLPPPAPPLPPQPPTTTVQPPHSLCSRSASAWTTSAHPNYRRAVDSVRRRPARDATTQSIYI